METFGKICLSVLLFIGTAIIGGLVFAKLWTWFVVYAFHVKPLSLIEAMGCSFFIGYLKADPLKKNEEEINMTYILSSIFTILFHFGIIMGMAWILVQFQ